MSNEDLYIFKIFIQYLFQISSLHLDYNVQKQFYSEEHEY